MPLQKIREFLDSHDVRYTVLIHSKAFTAPEIAAMAHIPGRRLAKTVMVDIDGRLAMAVLPAHFRVSLERLRAVTGSHQVSLADEEDFKRRFPDCEPGAMPPFGNLYDMDVYVDPTLTDDGLIAFNAGNHVELIQLDYRDFERLVRPRVALFAS